MQKNLGQLITDLDSTRLVLEQTRLDLERTHADLHQKTTDLQQNQFDLDRTKEDLERKATGLEQTQFSLQCTKEELEIKTANLQETRLDLDRSKLDLESKLSDLEQVKSDLECTKTELEQKTNDLELARRELDKLKQKEQYDTKMVKNRGGRTEMMQEHATRSGQVGAVAEGEGRARRPGSGASDGHREEVRNGFTSTINEAMSGQATTTSGGGTQVRVDGGVGVMSGGEGGGMELDRRLKVVREISENVEQSISQLSLR